MNYLAACGGNDINDSFANFVAAIDEEGNSMQFGRHDEGDEKVV